MRSIIISLAGVVAFTCVGESVFASEMEPPISATPPVTSEATTTTTPVEAPKEAPVASSSASPTSSTSSSVTSTSVMATADPSATGNKADPVKITAGDEQAAAQLKRFKAAGYKPEVHNDVVVWCRREPKLGSRFDRKVCTTAHLLELQMNSTRSTLEDFQRNATGVPFSN